MPDHDLPETPFDRPLQQVRAAVLDAIAGAERELATLGQLPAGRYRAIRSDVDVLARLDADRRRWLQRGRR